MTTLLEKLEKIKKESKLDSAMMNQRLEKERNITKTPVPAVNLMLSGKYHGGFHGGLTVMAAPSRHFKSGLVLLAMKAYLDENPDGAAVFYDSENGAAKTMFNAYGYTEEHLARILWVEIGNMEELKHHLVKMLTKDVEKGDKLFIGLDSYGNLASLKEAEDAAEGATKTDMTRAKQGKSIWRIVTPLLARYDIPMVVVNHVYVEIGPMYPKTIMSGGNVDGDQKIVMADGSTVAMCNVQEGDLVATRFGPREVLAAWNPDTLDEGNPERFKITWEDGTETICSNNHKFLVDDDWVEANQLTAGEDVVSVKNKEENK